jgi:hypothetical protein
MQTRNLKIESTGDYAAGKVKPQIRLRGQWLERARFKPDNRVTVQILWQGVLFIRFLGEPVGPKETRTVLVEGRRSDSHCRADSTTGG